MVDPLRDVAGVGALADQVRRELYLYVSAQRSPVGRDQAAAALGIARHQAKFQLDRLEEAGLLEADFQRLSGRSGPGAGRPAKVYRRAAREISVSLPWREYALAGELMAEAITAASRDEIPVQAALLAAATARGRAIGHQATAGMSPGPGDPLSIAAGALVRYGYEPRVDGAEIVLVNCPFHALVRDHRDLVCGMNHALLGGMCERIGGLAAHLDPGAQRCCVVLRAGSAAGPEGAVVGRSTRESSR